MAAVSGDESGAERRGIDSLAETVGRAQAGVVERVGTSGGYGSERPSFPSWKTGGERAVWDAAGRGGRPHYRGRSLLISGPKRED